MSIPPAYLNEYLEDDNSSEGMKTNVVDVGKYLFFKMAVSGLVSPFEVARMLVQVQYNPLNSQLLQDEIDMQSADGSEQDFEERLSSYDRYLRAKTATAGNVEAISSPQLTLPTDPLGYIDERSIAIKSQSMVPNLKGHGILYTIKTVHRYNGFSSLWQGHTALWIHSVLAESMEQLADNFITESLEQNEEAIAIHSLSANSSYYILPRIAIGIALQPLEVARTRLTLQAVLKHEQKYNGLWHALKTIKIEEGWTALFQTPFLTALEVGLGALSKLVPTVLLSQYLETDSASIVGSFAYVGIRMACQTIYLSIALPCEVIRRRMYAQAIFKNQTRQSKLKPFLTRIDMSPVPYSSSWDAFKRIIQEEGFASLYRGMSLYMLTNAFNSLSLMFNVWMYFEEEYEETGDESI